MKKIFTGIRPTATLTIANLIGAAFPLLDLQKNAKDAEIMVFVATMHALTDHEVGQLGVHDVVKDYLALGLDPAKVTIFDQRSIRKEVALMTLYLERHMTVARVCRVPTLKDKLKDGQNPENATMLLAAYPIMMAADILLQDANAVPVGKDQFSHMEAARELADAFNEKYGNGKNILVRPETLNRDEPVNILALVGEGKMSKSKPEGAIFLTDDAENITKKMKKAETALEGEMSANLDSLLKIAVTLSPDRKAEIDALMERHMSGEKVMGDLKKLIGDIIITFTTAFQERRSHISDAFVDDILEKGGQIAKKNADAVLERVENALGF
jgi:tryptophanyl-tRNA synthetase